MKLLIGVIACGVPQVKAVEDEISWMYSLFAILVDVELLNSGVELMSELDLTL